MKFFKKKKLSQAEQKKIDERNKRIENYTAGLAEKYHLAERWQKAENFTGRHRIASIVVAYVLMTTMMVLTLVVNSKQDTARQVEKISIYKGDGSDMADIMKGMQDIRRDKFEAKEKIQEIGQIAARLKREIDSIDAIPNKTPEDSLQLKLRVAQARKLLYNK